MKCGDTCRHNISKLNLGLSVKLLQLPLQGSGKALDENLEGACSIFLQKSFILVRHIYWIFRLMRGGWLGCTRAFVKWHLWPYPLKFSLWSTATTHPHCHCTPRHPCARARSPRLVKPRHGWLGVAWYGMVWYGLVREPGGFIMKCGDTCRHNIPKLNPRLSVKFLQLPLQGSGKALDENLEGACSIFLQKSFILVRHIYWIFRLLRGGWLGCTRAFVKWHLWPYPLKFSLWSTATTHPHCYCTPRHPRARARSPCLVKPRHGWLGLAWYGMVWLGARDRPFHNEVRRYLPTQYLKMEFGTFCQVIAVPLSGFWEGIRRQFRRGMFHIFAKKFHFGTPHLLDFQVAAWWLARLYACFPKVAFLALPVEVFALVHCHHTPTLPLHPPPPLRARSLALSRQAKAWLAWLGMVWYGMAWCESQALS